MGFTAMGETARNGDNPQFCDACFTGDYPIKLALWPVQQARVTWQ